MVIGCEAAKKQSIVSRAVQGRHNSQGAQGTDPLIRMIHSKSVSCRVAVQRLLIGVATTLPLHRLHLKESPSLAERNLIFGGASLVGFAISVAVCEAYLYSMARTRSLVSQSKKSVG